MTIRVSELYRYPIKSTAGLSVLQLPLDALGAVDDRRWMLVDDDGRFMTQRDNSALALIHSHLIQSGLRLEARGHPTMTVPRPAASALTIAVEVWGDSVPVTDAGTNAARWCSNVLRVSCRLVHIASNAQRPLAPKYAGSVNPANRHVALSDGAPLLIISEASLTTLNQQLVARAVAPIGFDRFRPNIVLAGAGAHEEDTWRTIEIGGVTIGVGSPCPRCVITTIDQEIGIRSSALRDEPGGEPLRTLAAYRRQGSGVMFGMNATNATPGVIRVGDDVRILETR